MTWRRIGMKRSGAFHAKGKLTNKAQWGLIRKLLLNCARAHATLLFYMHSDDVARTLRHRQTYEDIFLDITLPALSRIEKSLLCCPIVRPLFCFSRS